MKGEAEEEMWKLVEGRADNFPIDNSINNKNAKINLQQPKFCFGSVGGKEDLVPQKRQKPKQMARLSQMGGMVYGVKQQSEDREGFTRSGKRKKACHSDEIHLEMGEGATQQMAPNDP
ncbi:hypothetical protein PIB30_061613 [Stylosanthes scabra]|uniref:Uncharacterized protein n=1 Tax=Stylosanthes scabra TaxID=79078 RepID=A0ABU6YLF5_9FABA|nr:hypothetical protein [Stylosanthes scabra]